MVLIVLVLYRTSYKRVVLHLLVRNGASLIVGGLQMSTYQILNRKAVVWQLKHSRFN